MGDQSGAQMKSGIISWNIRGLSNKDKGHMVKNVCSSQRVDVIMLQETKMEVVPSSLIKEINCFRPIG